MMPTINQLVRKNRQAIEKKSTAPALQKGFNSLHKKATDASAPQKRGTLDTAGVDKRMQARSKYGAKRPKAAKK